MAGSFSADHIEGHRGEYVAKVNEALRMAERDPASLAKTIGTLGIDSEDDRLAIALACANKNPGSVAENIRNFALEYEGHRAEVALKIASSRYDSDRLLLMEHFPTFEIRDHACRMEVACKFAESWGETAYKHKHVFGVETQEDQFSYAMSSISKRGPSIHTFAKGWGGYALSDEQHGLLRLEATRRDPQLASRRISNLELDQEALFEMSMECAKGDVSAYVEHGIKHDCQLASEAHRTAVAVECARQDPDCTFRNLWKFELMDPRNVYSVAFESAKKDAASAIFRIHRIENPFSGALEKALFDLDFTGCFNHVTAGIAYLARRLVGESPSIRKMREDVVEECMVSNLGLCKNVSSREAKAVMNRPGVLATLFDRALDSERVDNAVEIAREMMRREEGTTGRDGVLARFDAAFDGWKGREDLTSEQRLMAEHISLLRQYGVQPSSRLIEQLEHFGSDSHPLFAKVIGSCGETYGESMMASLTALYPEGHTLTHTEEKTIESFVGTGFRSFTPNAFEVYSEEFARSPRSADAMVRGWKEIAATLLSGKEASEEVKSDRLYPELVYEAYRPVGMTTDVVRSKLETIAGHQEHLEKWRFPEDGYPLRTGQKGDLSVKEGKTLDTVCITSISEIFTPSERAMTEQDFTKSLVKILQGGFRQIDKRAFVDFLARRSGDERIDSLRSQTVELGRLGWDVERVAKALPMLSELTGVVLQDMARQVMPEMAGAVRLNKNLEARVRKILDLPEGEALTADSVSRAVLAELEKVLAPERKQLKAEHSKIDWSVAGYDDVKAHLTKASHSYFGRAGAGLCTANELWSWNNPDFLQMVMTDERTERVIGNIQLHIFTNHEGAPSVLARLNPTTPFLERSDPDQLARGMLEVCSRFAAENALKLYVPEQTFWHELTNRDSFAPSLQRYSAAPVRHTVQITESHSVERICPVELDGTARA